MHPPPITMSTYRVSLPGDDGGVKGSHRLVSLKVEFFRIFDYEAVKI